MSKNPAKTAAARELMLPLLFVALMLGFTLWRPLTLGHDQAINLYFGGLLLEGKIPYVDFFDINPPLVFYLHALPVALARLLHANPILVYRLLVLALYTGSLFAIRNRLAALDLDGRGIILALYGACSLYLCVSPLDFGQREHLFTMLFLPWFFIRCLRWSEQPIAARSAVLWAIAAGIGASLKPFFVIAALAPELYWLLARRRSGELLAAEFIAFAATILTYTLHFLLLPHAMREALFQRWLPLIASGYPAYNAALTWLFEPAYLAIPFGAVALALWLNPPAEDRPGVVVWPLAILTTAATLFVYLGQRKGWFYHSIPALLSGVLLAGILLGKLRQASARPGTLKRPFALAAQSLAVAGFLFLLALNARERGWHRQEPVLSKLIEEHSRAGDPVLFLSTSVIPEFPLLIQLDRRPASRYAFIWPPPFFYIGAKGEPGRPFPYRQGPAVSAGEQRFLSELSEDVARERPPLVLIETGQCQGCPDGFELSTYFEQSGFIATALRGYKPIESAGKYNAWIRDL